MSHSLRPLTATSLKQRIATGLVLCVFGLIAGCKSNNYELRLQPDGPVLQRQLSVWIEGNADDDNGAEFGEFPEDRLRQIVTAYGVEMPATLAARHEFTGEFAARMPADIGGDGFYQSWPSSLGTAYVYVEQFRGNDALNAGIAQRQLAANRAVDVLLLWLETEFADSGDLEFLLDALDTKFRADLLDLNAYSWLNEALALQAFDDEALAVQLLHYMVKRGYFDASQVPAFYHAILRAEIQEDPRQMNDIVTRGFANRFGVPADTQLPAPLAAIRDDSQRYFDSFEEFLDNSNALRVLERSWAEADGEAVPGDDATAQSVFQATTPFDLIDIDLFGNGGRGSVLDVELQTHYEPSFTNGEWDEDRGVISWNERLVSDRKDTLSLPTSIYAMWVKPSVDFQLQHFGEVAIGEDLLGEYCIWRNGLSAQRGEEWDSFLESVESSAEFVAKVDAFRFSDSDADNPIAAATSYSIVSDLAEALE